MNRIEERMSLLQGRKEKAFITYMTAGLPDLGRTKDLIRGQEEAGTDVVELGIPFSDPTADGPVIQDASYRSIKKGTNVRKVFEMMGEIRREGVGIPVIFMMYYNTILHYGLREFAEKCREAGVDGLIVPDLPFEEQEDLQEALAAAGSGTEKSSKAYGAEGCGMAENGGTEGCGTAENSGAEGCGMAENGGAEGCKTAENGDTEGCKTAENGGAEECKPDGCSAGGYDTILIQLVSPVSKDRIPKILKDARGFAYCVSAMGVTGQGGSFHRNVADYLKSVKAVSKIPIMMGFGIRTPEDIQPVKEIIDGAIVGTHFIQILEDSGYDVETAKTYCKGFKEALKK